MESALADQFNRAARNGSPAGIAVRTGKPDYAIGRCNDNLAACSSGDTAISDGAGPVSNRSAKSNRQRLAAKGNAAFGRTVKLDDAGAHIGLRNIKLGIRANNKISSANGASTSERQRARINHGAIGICVSAAQGQRTSTDRKSTRLNSSH